MKTLFAFASLTLLFCAPHATAQSRSLRPSDTVTYTFEYLPHYGPFGDTVPTPPQAQWQAICSATDSATALRIDLFENSTTDSPLFTTEWTPDAPLLYVELPGAWQDQQGVVRFTGVRGTAVLESFDVRVLTPLDTFHYDEFRRTFAGRPAPQTPRVLVDFNRYVSPDDNDFATYFDRYYGVSQLPGAGIIGGAVGGSLAEITTYGFAVGRAGLRNLPGDTNEVSTFFKIVPARTRPSSTASFKLGVTPSMNQATLFESQTIAVSFFGPADNFALPGVSNFNWGGVTNTNWVRLTLNIVNIGESNRFTVSVSLQDYGLMGQAPVGPVLASVSDVQNAELARSPVLFPAFNVDGVRFGQTLVDDFAISGISYEPPLLRAVRADQGLNVNWQFPGTNFVLESSVNLTPPVNWSPVAETATHSGDQHSVVVPLAQCPRFFRLRYAFLGVVTPK